MPAYRGAHGPLAHLACSVAWNARVVKSVCSTAVSNKRLEDLCQHMPFMHDALHVPFSDCTATECRFRRECSQMKRLSMHLKSSMLVPHRMAVCSLVQQPWRQRHQAAAWLQPAPSTASSALSAGSTRTYKISPSSCRTRSAHEQPLPALHCLLTSGTPPDQASPCARAISPIA